VSDAIELCGGRNIFADSPHMAPVVNLEAVLAADPEVILVPEAAWAASWRRFPAMQAVRSGNLYAISVNEMHRHGPRAIEATALLCQRLEEARLRVSSPRVATPRVATPR